MLKVFKVMEGKEIALQLGVYVGRNRSKKQKTYGNGGALLRGGGGVSGSLACNSSFLSKNYMKKKTSLKSNLKTYIPEMHRHGKCMLCFLSVIAWALANTCLQPCTDSILTAAEALG